MPNTEGPSHEKMGGVGDESRPETPPENLRARPKRGQSLIEWARELLDPDLISPEVYDDFIRQNNSKQEQMEKRGLPHLAHYGFFNSVDEMKERFSGMERDRLIIRCSPKEGTEKDTGIVRLVDTDIDGACQVAEGLPGGFEKWDVELKEFAPTIRAGTIIVESSGRTTIETWHGPHYLNTDEGTPKYHALFDPEHLIERFEWTSPEGTEDLSDMQASAIGALKYVFPNVKPRPNEPIYLEYGIKPGGDVYFLDVNDSPVLTGNLESRGFFR